MSSPLQYPHYISRLSDLSDRTAWQRKYLEAYGNEYSLINSNWYGLKAVIYSVALASLTLFAAIMTGSNVRDVPLKVALILSMVAMGTAATICTAIYYGVLADENDKQRRNFSSTFPLRFEIVFNEAILNNQKKIDAEE